LSAGDANANPFSEFIDDYFVECDEHLAVARRSLLDLEPSVDRPHINRPLLDELFRTFHSIKGLSAMVGIRGVEHLAHQMESYLSALRKEQVRLTTDGLETLITGVQALDQILAAQRGHTPPPNLSLLLPRFEALVRGSAPDSLPAPAPEDDALGLSAENNAALAAAVRAGATAWRFTFVPSSALAERGVNVNAVRQRLQAVGVLIHAAPVVQAGGQIAFVFVVTTAAGQDAFAGWQDDGIVYAPYETAASTAPPEGSGPGETGTAALPSLIPTNVVRVDLARLDDLMRMVGELVISRARLDENLRHLGPIMPAQDWRRLQETNQAIERQLRDLREGVMRVRLVPIHEVFARMQFVVRDLTREYGKKIVLSLNGQETEIDKLLVERMLDPLLHLVRNAVSHGLETADERAAAGKPREGQLTLRANATGEIIVIEVEDDGRGIDAQNVLARARSAGMMVAEGLSDAAAVLDIICTPGFSTRDQADRASGRGVGMAVVRTVVEELGGSLTLTTQPGKGTRFTIQLPLTLAIADALIVSVCGQTFAVPQVAVREVIQVDRHALKTLENNELIPYRDGVLPLVRLAAFFGLSGWTEGPFHTLVIGSGAGMVGIAVHRVLGLREIVVRPLTDPLTRVPGVAGATELGDGRVVLILDALPLARAARKPSRGEKAPTPRQRQAPDLLGTSS
jgi:two-component system, chemotaxis family, sensor kinase CheA